MSSGRYGQSSTTASMLKRFDTVTLVVMRNSRPDGSVITPTHEDAGSCGSAVDGSNVDVTVRLCLAVRKVRSSLLRSSPRRDRYSSRRIVLTALVKLILQK